MPRKGCSNKGKYKDVPSDLFCGPEGGSCPGTFPVNTTARARAALAYARYAPNPEGIRRCVKRKTEKIVYIYGDRYSVTTKGKKVVVISS